MTPFTRKELEWFIVFYLTSFISTKAIAVYDISSNYDIRWLILCVITLMIALVAAAKIKAFNVFWLVRQTPKTIILLVTFMIADYKYWKKTGQRIKYDS